MLKWITEHGISTALIDPGKPWQNGVGESFNGKFRDECLSLEWFRSRAEAKVVIEQWRCHYNAIRPHLSEAYEEAKRARGRLTGERLWKLSLDEMDKGANGRRTAAFLIEKALYELRYEAANRPDWIAIPLRGLLELTT